MADTTVEEFSELLDAVTEGEDTKVDLTPPKTPSDEPPKAEKKKPGPKPKAKAPSTPPPAAQPSAPTTSEPSSKFFVAKGKSISTKSRGIVDAGKEVISADFSEGEKRLEELVTAGYLTKS